MKKILYIAFATLISLTVIFTSFELTLFYFHSPIQSSIIEPKMHSLTWIYLLKQKYITLIDLDIFDINEKRHLLDVKRLFERIYSIWITLLIFTLSIIIFFYFKSKDKLSIVISYTIILGVTTNILFIIISFNFLNSFTLLHQILFPNNSWIFQPNSILIKWFPISYFIEFFTIFIISNFIGFYILKNGHKYFVS